MFRASLFAVLTSVSALAQERVRVAVHPIVASGIEDPKLVADLNREVQVILAETKRVVLVAPEDVERRLAEEGGKCPPRGKERTDCLERVALATRAVYIVAVSVKRLGKEYELAGAIADADRVLLEQPESITVTDTGGVKIDAALKHQLRVLLLERMQVGALPADPRMRNPPQAVVVNPPAVLLPDVPPPPPPPPEVEERSSPSRRRIGFAIAGLGAAALVAGAVLLGVGASDSGAALNPGTGNVFADKTAQFAQGRSYQTAAGVMFGVGAAAAAGGLIVALTSGDGQTRLAVTPMPTGATVSLGGAW